MNRFPFTAWSILLAGLFLLSQRTSIVPFLLRASSSDSNSYRSLTLDDTNPIDTNLDHEFKNYRFIAFGTSRTWGSGLDDRRMAYPWLLSPNATNLAIRAAGPEVPAMCTKSLVGDDVVYDVIILEFFFHANDALVRLTYRLKKRFPKATFVFLVIWSPFQLMFVGPGENHHQSLKTIMENINPQSQTEYENSLTELMNSTKESDWEYFFHPRAKDCLEKSVRIADGIIVSQNMDPENIKPYIPKFGPLFVHDVVHFSESGHRWMRSAIVNLLRANKAKPSNELGEWDGRDICNTWYTQDGDTKDLVYDKEHLTINEFKEEKFALELKGTNETWLDVVNDMKIPAQLYINYMSMGPTNTKYPTVTVTVTNMGTHVTDTEIEIYPFEQGYTYPVHVVQQAKLGTLEPGQYKIRVKVTEEREWPFRLVGLMLTPSFELGSDMFEWTPDRPPLDSFVPALLRGMEFKERYNEKYINK